MKKCKYCENELTEKNWLQCRKTKKHYICSPCFNFKFKERLSYKNARVTDRKWSGLSTVHSRKVTNFIQDTVKRNKDLDLSFVEIANMMSRPCSYCGGFSSNNLNGLDRVDSSVGYLKSNVTPCCSACNYGKHTMNPIEYIKHCEKVSSFQKVMV